MTGVITSRRKQESGEYRAGHNAYAAGHPRKCPYNECDEKAVKDWWRGFTDAEIRERVGSILEKYGETWP